MVEAEYKEIANNRQQGIKLGLSYQYCVVGFGLFLYTILSQCEKKIQKSYPTILSPHVMHNIPWIILLENVWNLPKTSLIWSYFHRGTFKCHFPTLSSLLIHICILYFGKVL